MSRASGPSRSVRRPTSPVNDGMGKAWDRLKATLAKYRKPEDADKIRRDLTVIIVTVEREAARWMGNSDEMPEDWVFRILQEEEAGEYEMQMPD